MQRFPFETQIAIKFAIAMAIECVELLCVSIFSLSDAFVGIGCNCMLISMADDIQIELRSINESAIAKHNRLVALKRLSKFIKLHTEAKQLSNYLLFSWVFLVFHVNYL